MKSKFLIFSIGIVLAVVSLTVGYAAFRSELYIGDLSSFVRAEADIRIVGISLDSTTSNATSISEDYNIDNISSQISLPNADSSVTYKVNVTNFGNVPMGIRNIDNVPSNIKYELLDYQLKEKICNEQRCDLGVSKEITIRFSYIEGMYDSNNITYNINPTFEFKGYHVVYFNSLSGDNLPSEIMEGDTLQVTFTNPPEVVRVTIDSLITTAYTYTNGTLTINNVEGDILVEPDDDLLHGLYASGETKSGTMTITSEGNGVYEVHGTKATGNFFVRLSDVLYGTTVRDSLLTVAPVNTIISSPKKIRLEVTVLGGTAAVTGDNQFRVVFRGVSSSAAVDNSIYDFFSGYSGSGSITVPIGMITLFFNSAKRTFTNFRFQIRVYEEKLDSQIMTAPYDNFTVQIHANGLIELNGTKTSSSVYYIRLVPHDVAISSRSSDLYSSTYTAAPAYTAGQQIYFEYAPVQNVPSAGTSTAELSFGFRDTSTDSNYMPETRISMQAGNDLTINNRVEATLSTNAGFRFLYINEDQFVFENWQFYLHNGLIN